MSAYDKIYLMNTLIGHQPVEPNTKEFWEQIRSQTELVLEETKETLDAAIDEDPQELLDGVADIMVTAIGLYQKLILSGYQTPEALERVCDNNLTKFHRDPEHANETLEYYKEQGIETFVRLVTMQDGTEYYGVINKESGKLLKPHDFVGVVLSDLVENIESNWEKIKENEPTEQ
ncbi:MAG: hypothetical protein GOVbin1096_40 [Prokaryotic dsDNA virus sp.]|nr:MAG: hypothetical protein GOVbin1096_40 [Prokaryotic dsDNA virus sp.]|tara:strand:+ start:62218 stop:62742 length:525 start_codon:yes stop_codon:yes gene_type:complete